MHEAIGPKTLGEMAKSAGPAQTDDALRLRTEALLAELSEMAALKSRSSKWLSPLLFVGRWYLGGYTLFVVLVPATDDKTMLHPMFLIPLYSGILWAWLGDWMIWKSRARLKKLAGELSEDPRAAGGLAQLCHCAPFLSVAEIAATALLKVLPRVKASDARYFSDAQMQALLALLAVRNPYMVNLRQFTALPFAVLKALEQVGDRRAIEPVRRLTNGRGNRRYHQAAQECLAFLEQHASERDYNRTLLLPASVGVGEETLLRPTMPQAEVQPELLLRAVIDKERG